MKKVICIFLVLSVLVILPLTTFATEAADEAVRVEAINQFDIYADKYQKNEIELIDTYSINQYDQYLEMKTKNEKNLLSEGYNIQDIIAVQNLSFEKEFLERAKLSTSELLELGYNEREAALIQAYDGSPLEDNPQMRAVSATFTGSLYRDGSSKTSSTTIFTWKWSSAPAVCLPGLSDYVSCAWEGTNKSNIKCQMVVYGKNCVVNFSNGRTSTVPVTTKHEYQWVQAKVQQNGAYGWAKSGSLSVQTREVVNTNGKLAKTLYYYSFGHSTMATNAGVSLSPSGPSLGFTFNWGVTKMYHNPITVSH